MNRTHSIIHASEYTLGRRILCPSGQDKSKKAAALRPRLQRPVKQSFKPTSRPRKTAWCEFSSGTANDEQHGLSLGRSRLVPLAVSERKRGHHIVSESRQENAKSCSSLAGAGRPEVTLPHVDIPGQTRNWKVSQNLPPVSLRIHRRLIRAMRQ